MHQTRGGSPDDVRAYWFLAVLGGWLTFAAAMATTILVSETAIDYVEYMLGRRADLWVTALFVTSGTAVIAVNFILVHIRTRALRRSLADTAENTRLALRTIKVATVLTIILAVAGSFVGVGMPRVPRDELTEPSMILVIAVLALTFLLPTIISIAICYSVPSTPPPTSAGHPLRRRR